MALLVVVSFSAGVCTAVFMVAGTFLMGWIRIPAARCRPARATGRGRLLHKGIGSTNALRAPLSACKLATRVSEQFRLVSPPSK
jgi:hypothetical protein